MDVHVDVLTRAERAADAGEGDPDELLGQAEARRDLRPVHVQPLGRDVEVDAAVLGRDRESALGAERSLVLHRGLVVALDPDLRLGALELAVDDVNVAEHVAEVVHAGRVGVERRLHVHDRRQRLVVDLDELAAARGCSRRVGGDERDRLARVADDLLGEHRLVGDLEPERPLARKVLGEQTAATPGLRSAPEGSIERIRAEAWGLRTVTPQSIRGARGRSHTRTRPHLGDGVDRGPRSRRPCRGR